jgi:NADH-quinone oxidoreductase subunit C
VAIDEAPDLAWVDELATTINATATSTAFDTVHLYVDRDDWVDAIRTTRDSGFPFLSWISATDWSKETEVGEPVVDVDGLEERFEVMARLSSLTDGRGVMIVAIVPKDDPIIESVVPLFGGAEWHEREAAEMFGIEFRGNPNLTNLYLPDAFEGYPLRKSFPLLSREVKPWPGTVDVEDMPSTENTEAAAQEAAQAEGGDA